jgi:hypothetical protein
MDHSGRLVAHTKKILAPEARLQHSYNRILLGNYLCLPNQRYGHETHGKDADRQHQTSLGFRRWNVRYPPQPIHVKGLLSAALKSQFSVTPVFP